MGTGFTAEGGALGAFTGEVPGVPLEPVDSCILIVRLKPTILRRSVSTCRVRAAVSGTGIPQGGAKHACITNTRKCS